MLQKLLFILSLPFPLGSGPSPLSERLPPGLESESSERSQNKAKFSTFRPCTFLSAAAAAAAKSLQSCPTLRDPIDSSPPGSPVPGILQARALEWVAISFLMKVKEESDNAGLKLSIQKTKTMASGPITSGQIDGGTVETVAGFIFWGSKIVRDQTTVSRT